MLTLYIKLPDRMMMYASIDYIIKEPIFLTEIADIFTSNHGIAL